MKNQGYRRHVTKTRNLGRLATASILGLAIVFPSVVQATAQDTEYQLGQDSLVNTGKDNGFSNPQVVDKDDVHWGWQLGNFYVSDFTRVIEDSDDAIFLKNVGDEITLWFDLEQDIDRLNEDDHLSISEDKNGWDKKYQVDQQNFGHGMLIVKHTDYTNKSQTTLYQNFLAATASPSAATKVEVFEEGDYEVALDYEIQKPWTNIFGWEPGHNYSNYQISFKFSVRNGNSMVFPFDVVTGEELTNTAATANGFRLDLAKSRYLDIDIKREVLNETGDGLVEDTRFNKPAADGNEYTDEGTYTITVRNRYTDQETTKTIYVGTDEVLKAHAATGLSIEDINALLAEGATITADGSIVPVRGPVIDAQPGENSEANRNDAHPGETGPEPNNITDNLVIDSDSTRLDASSYITITAVALSLALLTILAVFFSKHLRMRRAASSANESDSL